MKQLMVDLYKLQALEIELEITGPSENKAVKELRKNIPEQILGHYDRVRVRGKKGVAIIRNNTCTECHMKVPTGTIVTLYHGTDIQLCGSCGRYLYLPEDAVITSSNAPLVVAAEAKPKRKRAPRKAAENVS